MVDFIKRYQLSQNGLDLENFQRVCLIQILIIEGVASVAWQLFADNQSILLLTLALHMFAIWLAFEHFRLAGPAWTAAVFAVVMATVIIYQSPLVTFVLCLMPLLTVLIYGLFGGLMMEGIVTVVMLGFARRFPELPDLTSLSLPVIVGGLAALIIGGVIRYWFVDTLSVYYSNYLQANRGIEEARQQRVEMKNIQEDLQHANREMTRLTRQLKLVNQTAEEARQAKETFVATVSHELRTPLNMIIGFSEVIAQSPQVYKTRLPATLLADIASIQRNSQHLLELVNDVLDLSQVDMGNLSITRSPCSLNNLVDEAFDVIRPLFNSKGLYLKTELPEEELIISCDQTRVREVIINLLSNAGRFTEKGGVCIRAKQDGAQLIIGVQDTGPGISAENQKKLFEPFQQLDSSIRRQHGGSGLGLAISKRFVEMHGGQMWLESSLGSGTTFSFSLPLQTPDLPSSSAVGRWVNPYSMVDGRSRPFKAPPNTLVPCCVVLEAGEKVSHLFQRYLDNVEILTVGDVEAAGQCLAESPAQLLVVNHPQAADLALAVLEDERIPFGLPIMSFWLPSSVDMADSLNIEKYLIKPVAKQALLDAIAGLKGGSVQTILLVDDNPEVLQLFGRILASSEKKYTVLRASDGQQALAMMRKRIPDVVILDLLMPEMNGFQLLKEKAALADIRAIPVIVVSAQDPAGVQKVDEPIMLARKGGFTPRDLLELSRSIGFAPDKPNPV